MATGSLNPEHLFRQHDGEWLASRLTASVAIQACGATNHSIWREEGNIA